MLSVLTSCGGDEPIDPTPAKDTKAPVVSVSQSSVNVIGGLEVTLGTSELKIGDKTVATWKDDVSQTCKSALELDGKAITTGTKLSEPGKLKLTVSDDAGNSADAEINLTKEDTQAPKVSITIADKNVIAGVKVSVKDNQLLFDDTIAASWTDDYSIAFSVELSLLVDGASPKAINSGDVLLEAGKLTLSVADEFQNKGTGDINLTAIAVFGLEKLAGLQLQVDQDADLMNGLTIADDLTLQKVEIVQDGARTEVENPNAYTPEYPGSIDIILTLARADGSTIEVKGNDLTVKGLDYHAVSLIDIKPVDVFPQIDQIEAGDPNIYSYVEDLRVAEAYVMREMMTEYGVGNYSPEEYQQLLSRIVIGSRSEVSDDYQEYPWI